MVEVSPSAKPGLRDGTGAIVIALVYALAGPIVGLLLIVPFSAIAAADFRAESWIAGLYGLLISLPLSVPLAYYFAGLIALATGVVIAAVAHRRGRAPAWLAFAAPVGMFVAFGALDWLIRTPVPGAALLNLEGNFGWPVWLGISIAASLVCWAVTLPVQRRSR